MTVVVELFRRDPLRRCQSARLLARACIDNQRSMRWPDSLTGGVTV
jgi:hypothetical protein